LPEEADIDTAKATYNNGILEMTFNKKGAGNIGKKIEVD
jgi:HSP20 family protein